jgi:hypothetical protein
MGWEQTERERKRERVTEREKEREKKRKNVCVCKRERVRGVHTNRESAMDGRGTIRTQESNETIAQANANM